MTFATPLVSRDASGCPAAPECGRWQLKWMFQMLSASLVGSPLLPPPDRLTFSRVGAPLDDGAQSLGVVAEVLCISVIGCLFPQPAPVEVDDVVLFGGSSELAGAELSGTGWRSP
jgi:hypothetical protein